MGKKNKLKASVNRGFATTSVIKVREKIEEEVVNDTAKQISDSESEQEKAQRSSLVFSTKQTKLAKKYEANAWKRLESVESYFDRIKKEASKVECPNIELSPSLFTVLYDWVNSRPFLCKSFNLEEEEEEYQLNEQTLPYTYESLPLSQPYDRRVFGSFRNAKDTERALNNLYTLEFYGLKLGFDVEKVREALAFIGAKSANLPNVLDYVILYEKDSNKVPLSFKSFRAIQQEDMPKVRENNQEVKAESSQTELEIPPPLEGDLLEPKCSRELAADLSKNEVQKIRTTILDNLIDLGQESSDDEYMLDYDISLSQAKLEVDNIIYKRLEAVVLHAGLPIYLDEIQNKIKYLSRRTEKMKSAFYYSAKEAKFHLSELLRNQEYRTYEIKNTLSLTLDQEVAESHAAKQAEKLKEKETKSKQKPEIVKRDTNGGESDEEFELDLDSIFENEDPMQSAISPKFFNHSNKHILDLELPKSWTGKSPKQLLLGFSKSKKCVVTVTTSHEKTHRSKVVVSGKIGSVSNATCTFTSDYKVTPNSDITNCSQITSMSTNDFIFEAKSHSENYASTIALYLLGWVTNTSVLPPVFQSIVVDWMKEKEMSTDLTNNKELITRYDFLSLTLNPPKEEEANIESKFNERSPDFVPSQHTPKKETSANFNGFKEQVPYWSRRGKNIKATMLTRLKTKEYKETLALRTQLPVHGYKEVILDTIYKQNQDFPNLTNISNNVTLVVGETGCGKTTQIPQLLVEDAIKNNRPCQVLCTQPRRISAMSIAERVSFELGDGINRVGTEGSLVGYQGVLLRRLESDRELSMLSHLVIDEIQERSLETDFLLIVVRELLKRSENKLKVILMSATIDADQFSKYFDGCPILKIPGRTFPVQVHYLDDIVEKVNYVLDPESRYCRRDYFNREQVATKAFDTKGGKFSGDLDYDQEDMGWSLEVDSLKVSKNAKRTLAKMRLDIINYDLIYQLILFTHTAPDQFPQGSILIFMPGIPEIKVLYNLLMSDPQLSNPDKFWVLEAHSAIAPEKQSQVFVIPPLPIRKVVLATNIAETGITIPDVTIVVDSGRMKQMSYDKKAKVSHLEEVDVAQANALQRQGRAGRVQPGVCFRLYFKSKFDSMVPYQSPEMTRLPLDDLCLRVKVYGYNDVSAFLSKAIYPPPPDAVRSSLNILQEVGAMTKFETLTPLGLQLSKLPVAVYLGKIILFGTLFRCLDPALTIAAILSYKSPFSAFGLTNNFKAEFLTEHCDFLTVYKAYTLWKDAVNQGGMAEGTKFCTKHGLSLITLLQLEEIKRQYFNLLLASKLVGVDPIEHKLRFKVHPELCFTPPSLNLNSNVYPVVKCVLVSGLYPKILHFSPKAGRFFKVTSDKTTINFNEYDAVGGGFYGQVLRASNIQNTAIPVSVSNASVLTEGSSYRIQATSKFHFATYFDLMKTKSINLNVSAISTVTPLPILLFAKSVLPLHQLHLVLLDNLTFLKVTPYNLALLIQLRNQLKSALDLAVHTNRLSLDPEFLGLLVKVIQLDYKS